MSLRRKLDRRSRSASPTGQDDSTALVPLPTQDKTALLENLRSRMARLEARGRSEALDSGAPVTESGELTGHSPADLPGEAVDTPHGQVWVRRLRYDANDCHGKAKVGGFHEAGEALAALARDERLEGFDSRGALLLDLETTGLERGAGTLPFLVGLGWFEHEGALQVELLLCRDPSEEPAALFLLAERLAHAKALVTFNGRSFDVPLINTRFVLNRMKNPGWALPHLDLLLAARRVFKRRLKDCSLGHLERSVLDFERVGDIPSAQIPSTYVAYLRGQDQGAMASVLDHNALDIVALAALGGVLGRLYLEPDAVEHTVDHLGLASLALRIGDADSAGAHLGRAMGSQEGLTGAEAAVWSARAAARRGDIERALELYHRAVELDSDCAVAQVALSKLYEHHRKDYARALRHAQAAQLAEGEEGAARREARLRAKLERQGSLVLTRGEGDEE